MVDYEPKTVLYVRDMPAKLRNEFKSWCSAHGTNMTEKVKDLIKDFLERESKNNGRQN